MDTYDLEIVKGSTYSLNVTLKDGSNTPIDLTDYSISGYLKYKYSDATKLLAFNIEKLAPFSGGNITISIPATGTAVLPVSYGFYDIELVHSSLGTTSKILNGKASIYPEVTY